MSKFVPVIVTSIPYKGKEKKLLTLIALHEKLLRKKKYCSGKEHFVMKSKNGAIVEVFEWRTAAIAKKAHKDKEVLELWSQLSEVCDFGKLEMIPESKLSFPHFKSIG